MALTASEALARVHALGVTIVVERDALPTDRPLSEAEVREAIERRNGSFRDHDFDPEQVLNYNILDPDAAIAFLGGLGDQAPETLAALRGEVLDLGAFSLRLRRGNGFGVRALSRAWKLEGKNGHWVVTPHVDLEDAARDLRVAISEEAIREKVLATLEARIEDSNAGDHQLWVYRETASRRLSLMQRVRLRLSKLVLTALEGRDAFEEITAEDLQEDIARLSGSIDVENTWVAARLPPRPDGGVDSVDPSPVSADIATPRGLFGLDASPQSLTPVMFEPASAGPPSLALPIAVDARETPSVLPASASSRPRSQELEALIRSLTRASASALSHAFELAVEYRAGEVTGEHLLLALLETPASDVACLYAAQPAAAIELVSTLRRALADQEAASAAEPGFRASLVAWLSDAARLVLGPAPSPLLRSAALLSVLAHNPRLYLEVDLNAHVPRLVELLGELDGPSIRGSAEQVEITARAVPEPAPVPLANITVRVAYPSGARLGRGARRELPPKLLVIGDFSAGRTSEPFAVRRPWRLDHDTVDAALARRAPWIDLPLGVVAAPMPLEFGSLADFSPDAVARRLFALRRLNAQLLTGAAALDPELAAGLERVLHYGPFVRLERAWRSLQLLLDHASSDAAVRIEVLDCTLEEVTRDFDESPSITQSVLFGLLHKNEYGVAGGNPFTAVISDHCFGKSLPGLVALRRCASIAAMVHAPFLAELHPWFVGYLRRLRTRPAEPYEAFDTLTKELWQGLVSSEEARYVGLTSQALELRAPYLPGAPGVTTVAYAEGGESPGLLGSGAFAVAAQLMSSLSRDRSGAHLEGPIHSPFDLTPALGPREADDLGAFGLLPFSKTDGPPTLHARSCRLRGLNGARVPRGDLEHSFFASRFLQPLKWLYLETAWAAPRDRVTRERRANEWLAEYVATPAAPERPLLAASFRIEREGDSFDRVRVELVGRAVDGSGVPIACTGWFRTD